jgi:hypothetical protein
MSASGLGPDGPAKQESLEKLFGTVFGLAEEIASQITRDHVETRLRRTLQEAGHHQEEKPAGNAEQRSRAAKASRNDQPVAELASRAANGDQNAWNEIVERYSPLILSICRRHGLGRADTTDVAQIVWLRLVEHLASLRDPAALPGWLAITTHRECLRIQRKRWPGRLEQG